MLPFLAILTAILDVAPPVQDLTVDSITANSVILRFSVPPSSYSAEEYEVRYSPDGPLTDATWDEAFELGSFGVYAASGQPETILGRPVVEVVDMEDVGAAAEPILFGDIATAFRIIDRLELSILVNPYILATNGVTRIHATRRVGSAVVQPAAIKKIRCATS